MLAAIEAGNRLVIVDAGSTLGDGRFVAIKSPVLLLEGLVHMGRDR